MIIAKNISYSILKKPILQDISLQLCAGNLTAIIGPNGAGKSTLMKCLTGFYKPDSGLVNFQGKPIEEYSINHLAQKRAFLSAGKEINFPFKSREIVHMGRNPFFGKTSFAEDEKIVKETLKSIDAWHLRNRIFSELSSGEKQRVQIARVLSQVWDRENACLFLDEPTSAQDLKHQHSILSLISHLSQERNFSICIILHDFQLVLRYAKELILMKGGQIHSFGETKKILNAQNITKVFEVSADLLPF